MAHGAPAGTMAGTVDPNCTSDTRRESNRHADDGRFRRGQALVVEVDAVTCEAGGVGLYREGIGNWEFGGAL